MNKKIFTKEIVLAIWIISMSWVLSNDAFAQELISVYDDNTMFQTSTFLQSPFTENYFTLEEFEREGQSRWYAFDGIEGEVITIKTRVPNIPNSSTFTPCFDLLIGEDKVTPTPERVQVFDDFYGVEWIETCSLTFTLPDNGLYYIRAHDELHHYEAGDTGKFSLVVGENEDLSFFDRLMIPFWIIHVNLFFENLVYVWIMLTLVLVAVVIGLFLLKKRENNN